eukprot:TRINITY_DN103595_c0_g1_i1.p1 TRINITY_DN103595_c0_g1~~TRINITY_DN103595_c0_g1_i1.p1  ORF type:complete len:703 (+),score=153.58 TRINITY_DN103595_c0_g1_i1:77-2110(+)
MATQGDMKAPLRGEAPTPVSEGSASPGGRSNFSAVRQRSAEFERSASADHGDVENGASRRLSMEWKDLDFAIGDKRILKSLTGLVAPGRLTGVLGPSGSGKSTLMNVLAGRQRTNAPGMSFSGTVTAAGRVIDPVDFRSSVAYVMQDDALLPTETPREYLTLSAKMRLPGTISEQERSALVEDILKTLHLTGCAETIVGSALVKGISGGERKRTAVGVELITNPKLLFLDEPLSGLDSYAAFTLMQAMKDLAKANVPVFLTVHQPSSDIFAMFDDIILLHEGEVCYHGPVDAVVQHFGTLGFPCPANFNPADHIMFTIQRESPEKIAKIKTSWHACELAKNLVSEVVKAQAEAVTGSRAPPPPRGVGFFGALQALLRREARAFFRNKGIIGARFGMASFLSILYAWLFAGTGSADRGSDGPCLAGNFNGANCFADTQAHYGTLVSLAISSMMGAAQPIMLTFPSERPVFLREYAAQQYGVVPYFISKTLVEAPVVLGTQILTFLIAYWIMDLQGNFVMLVLYAWLLGIASSSLALIIGCGVASAEKAIQFGPLVLLPQMLFSGLFVPVGKVPQSLRWVQYLCPLKYAINLLEITEFRYVKNELDECVKLYKDETRCYSTDPFNMSPYPGAATQNGVLAAQSVDWDEETLGLMMLLILFVAFRLIATFVLWRKGKYVF